MKRRHFIQAGITAGLASSIPFKGLAAVPSCSSYWYYFNRNISNDAHNTIGNLIAQYLAEVAFTPSGGWVVVSGAGTYQASGIPNECYSKLQQFINAGERINSIAFPPAGGNRWVIVSETNLFSKNIPTSCFNQLVAKRDAGDEVYCVAFPPSGGWVILTDRSHVASGIPSQCYNAIQSFAASGDRARHVAFTPGGGWIVLSATTFVASNIPQECYDKIVSWWQAGARITKVSFAPNGGWHASSNEPTSLPTPSGGLADVRSVMVNNSIPGLAAVVIKNNAVHLQHYYGRVQRGSCKGVSSSTRFQAASVSKVVAAAGAVRFTELNNTITSIGTNVRPHLGITLGGISGGFNLEQLLTHTAGINVSGFPGYRRGLWVPDTEGIIAGDGNTPEIRKVNSNGTFSYSGGGYTLVQQLIENLTGQNYGNWMWTNVLSLLGMSSSSFVLDPNLSDANLAVGHDSSGYPIGRRRHMYPEYAAAGMYTTALDLRRLVVAINNGGVGPTGVQVWNAADGASVGLGGGNYTYTGANEGFRSLIWGRSANGNGVTLLANANTNALPQIRDLYINAYSL